MGLTVHLARLGGYYKVRGYYEHAHAWVGNTRGLCDYLVAQGLPRDRVHLIGNFVEEPDPVSEEEVHGLRESYALPSDALVLYSLARFIDIKGIDDLLRAFALLPPRPGGRPLTLVVSGDGPLRADLHRLAADLGLSDRVRWTGWQARPGPFYRAADLFVCPSRHETLGNVILEAWSYGKPVVSTDTPGALELVDDGRTGLLAPRADPPALARRIEAALLGPPERLRALAEAGRASVLAEHSRHAVVSAYTQLYDRLSAERRSATTGAGVVPGT
jgi:glycosyltransferase involved in cell wall biosynthesis